MDHRSSQEPRNAETGVASTLEGLAKRTGIAGIEYITECTTNNGNPFAIDARSGPLLGRIFPEGYQPASLYFGFSASWPRQPFSEGPRILTDKVLRPEEIDALKLVYGKTDIAKETLIRDVTHSSPSVQKMVGGLKQVIDPDRNMTVKEIYPFLTDMQFQNRHQ